MPLIPLPIEGSGGYARWVNTAHVTSARPVVFQGSGPAGSVRVEAEFKLVGLTLERIWIASAPDDSSALEAWVTFARLFGAEDASLIPLPIEGSSGFARWVNTAHVTSARPVVQHGSGPAGSVRVEAELKLVGLPLEPVWIASAADDSAALEAWVAFARLFGALAAPLA